MTDQGGPETPATAAGRALLADWGWLKGERVRDLIVAIERESRAVPAGDAALREALRRIVAVCREPVRRDGRRNPVLVAAEIAEAALALPASTTGDDAARLDVERLTPDAVGQILHVAGWEPRDNRANSVILIARHLRALAAAPATDGSADETAAEG